MTTFAIVETDGAELDFIGTLSTEQREFDTTVSFEECVAAIAEDYAMVFKDLYDKQRGFILHGYASNPSSRLPLTDKNVDDAQVLAQNALRLMMKLIADNPTWATREEVENWFATP